MRRPGVRGMDAVARDKLVSLVFAISEKVPVLKVREKEVLGLCRRFGKVLYRAGITKIPVSSKRDVHVSRRGIFYHILPPECSERELSTHEYAKVIEGLVPCLEAVDSKLIDTQSKLDTCWESLNEFFRRMEQLNGQRANQ